MFKDERIEDLVLIILIITILGGGVVIFFKDRGLGSGQSIQINTRSKEVETDNSSNKIDRSDLELKDEEIDEDNIFVHIAGAVTNPGVYKCHKGARIYEVLKKAGGTTSEANLNLINLVDRVNDGTKVIIPIKGENNGRGQAVNQSTDSKININTANQEKLEELSGVGPATAQKIITYRQQQGGFNNLKDLMKVPGIGTKTFAKLESRISN